MILIPDFSNDGGNVFLNGKSNIIKVNKNITIPNKMAIACSIPIACSFSNRFYTVFLKLYPCSLLSVLL